VTARVPTSLYEEISNLYAGGAKVGELASTIGVTRNTIYRILRRTGTPLDPSRRTRVDRDAVAAAYAGSDMTVGEVAKALGFGYTGTRNALLSLGVEIERRRKYDHRFDYDEARLLHDQGIPHSVIAKRLGVTPRSIGIAAKGGWLDASRECVDCGAAVDPGSQRCVACNNAVRVKRDGEGRYYCPTCDTWKDPESFTIQRSPYRPVRGTCRSCDTALKREWRRTNPEKSRESERRAKARRRQRAAESA
jgi:hypothetical protein